jgi:hypothetical protein
MSRVSRYRVTNQALLGCRTSVIDLTQINRDSAVGWWACETPPDA